MSDTADRRGQFRKGDDPRRHRFTVEECRKGYERALDSLSRRYPGSDPHFLLCAITGAKPWHTLPQVRRLLDRDEPISDADALRLFAGD